MGSKLFWALPYMRPHSNGIDLTQRKKRDTEKRYRITKSKKAKWQIKIQNRAGSRADEPKRSVTLSSIDSQYGASEGSNFIGLKS